jgi:hypothetical protein
MAPQETYAVHVAPDATSLIPALNDWTTATGVTFGIVLTLDLCDQPWTCFSVSTTSPAEVVATCGPGTVGCTGEGFVLVANAGDTLHTARHEIGHALGLVHVSDVGQLMYPTTDGSAEITPGDVAQYWSLRDSTRSPR